MTEEKGSLLVLWPTVRCNLQCVYCYADAKEAGQDMSWETARSLLERFSGQKLKIQFAGGEPLLRPEFLWQTAEYIRREHPGTALQIQTNGTLITRDIAVKLKAYGFAVGMSLDGPASVNERFRGNTRGALKGISHLAEAGIDVGLNAVLTAENLDGPIGLAKMALVFPNIRGIALDILRCSGRASRGRVVPPSPEQAAEALKRLYEETRRLERLIQKPIAIRAVEEAKGRLLGTGEQRYHCYASLGRSYVALPNGEIYPCGSLAGDRAFLIGRAGEARWEERCLPALPNSDCLACSWEQWCTKGCPARASANGRQGQRVECALKKMAFTLADAELKETKKK